MIEKMNNNYNKYTAVAPSGGSDGYTGHQVMDTKYKKKSQFYNPTSDSNNCFQVPAR